MDTSGDYGVGDSDDETDSPMELPPVPARTAPVPAAPQLNDARTTGTRNNSRATGRGRRESILSSDEEERTVENVLRPTLRMPAINTDMEASFVKLLAEWRAKGCDEYVHAKRNNWRPNKIRIAYDKKLYLMMCSADIECNFDLSFGSNTKDR